MIHCSIGAQALKLSQAEMHGIVRHARINRSYGPGKWMSIAVAIARNDVIVEFVCCLADEECWLGNSGKQAQPGDAVIMMRSEWDHAKHPLPPYDTITIA